MDDLELLHEYAVSQSEEAFATLEQFSTASARNSNVEIFSHINKCMTLAILF